MICDGLGDHTSLKVVRWARPQGVILIIRPPHTSGTTQPEDVINFAILKPKFDQSKLNFLTKRMIHGGRHTKFTSRNVMETVKPAWMDAFNIEHCRSAWERTSYLPFNREIQIDQEKVEEKLAKYKEKFNAPKPNGELNLNALRLPSAAGDHISKKRRREGEEYDSDDEMSEEEDEEGDAADAPLKRRKGARVGWDQTKGAITSDAVYALLEEREKEVAAEQQDKEQKRETASQKKEEKKADADALAKEVLEALGVQPWNDDGVRKLVVPKIKALITFRGEKPLKGNRDVVFAQMIALYGHSSAPAALEGQAPPVAAAAAALPAAPAALGNHPNGLIEVLVGGGGGGGGGRSSSWNSEDLCDVTSQGLVDPL
jgi:hypothetical protein